MRALVILMIEAEQPEGLSSRKLVVETAKHNVLTAYNAPAGIDLLQRFPNVDAILVHDSLLERNGEFLKEVKKYSGKSPIIVATPLRQWAGEGADYVVDSHRPHELLELLQTKLRWQDED